MGQSVNQLSRQADAGTCRQAVGNKDRQTEGDGQSFAIASGWIETTCGSSGSHNVRQMKTWDLGMFKTRRRLPHSRRVGHNLHISAQPSAFLLQYGITPGHGDLQSLGTLGPTGRRRICFPSFFGVGACLGLQGQMF